MAVGRLLVTTVVAVVLVLGFARLAAAAGDPVRNFWAVKWQRTLDTAVPASTVRGGSEGFDWQYKQRAEFSAQDTQYLLALVQNDCLLLAPDVEDHLARLLAEVHPGPLPDGHPGALHIRVEIDAVPNAYVLSSGMVIVTTGLLSLLRSDDELRSVLAHEVAHVYGDDRMEARNAAESRAGFAAALSVFAGVAAGALAVQSGDPSVRAQAGLIGVGTGLAAGVLSSLALESLGFRYSRKQEKEADAVAQEWLQRFGTDSLAFGRALDRLDQWARLHGASTKSALLDTHPSNDSRLAALGFRGERRNAASREIDYQPEYDARLEKVLSREASLALQLGRYNDALALTNRAITSGWPDADVMLVRATSLRLTETHTDSLRQAAVWLDRAEKGGCDRTAVLVERAVLDLRLHDEPGAAKALDDLLALCTTTPCDKLSGVRKWAADTRSQLRLRAR